MKKRGDRSHTRGGTGARAPASTGLRVLAALVLVVFGVLAAGAAAGRRGRPATGDSSGAR